MKVMSENKPSLAETAGQDFLSHKQKIANHVHSKTTRAQHSTPDNPLIGYLEQKTRINTAPFTETPAALVYDPKKDQKIQEIAEDQFKANMSNYQKLTEAKDEVEDLKYDGLTKESKVFTRKSGDIAFQTAINDAIRNKQSIGLLMVDHDFFKLVNDNFGHPAGDKVIKEIAATLRELTKRRNDFILRYGGEEFAVVFPAITIEKLKEKADLIEQIYDRRQQTLKGPTNPVFDQRRTISRGITHLDPTDPRIQGMVNGEIVDLLYAEADDALLAAKELGRNQTQNYSEIDDKFKKNTRLKVA